MRHHIRRRALTGVAVAAASVVLAACGGSGGLGDEKSGGGNNAAGGDPCGALEGEKVTFVVPYNPGGGFDTFVRLLQPHLEKQLPDTTITVSNKPGGGGLIGANEVYQSDPKDLTIGLINYPGAVFAELTGQEGASFDNTKWTILGRLGALPPLVYTGPKSEYKDFDSIRESKDSVKFGVGGVGSDAYYVAVARSKIFKFPNEIIGGYPGSSEADAALLVGEVDASINSGGAGVQMVEGSKANPIVVVSNEPLKDLPDTPVIGDFADADNEEVLSALASMYDLERVVVAPPGMDDGTADCLADAINAAANEPGYAEEMEKAEYPINPLSRDETVALAEKVGESVDALRDLLKK